MAVKLSEMCTGLDAVETVRFALEFRPRGGFVLAGDGGETFEAVADAKGWVLRGSPPAAGWWIECEGPSDGSEGGVRQRVLRETKGDDAAEIGRAIRSEGKEPGEIADVVLLADGRLFRLVRGEVRRARIAVMGWECPGAYLVAEPGGGGFTIEREPAGRDLPGFLPILLLLSAEIAGAVCALEGP